MAQRRSPFDELDPTETDGVIFPGLEETREEVRELAVGPAAVSKTVTGRHPPNIPRPVVGKITDIQRNVGEIVDNTALLQILISRLKDVQDILVAIGTRTDLTYSRDYVFVSQTVTSGTSRELDVSTRLGRLGRRGWLKKDTPTGQLLVAINGQKQIEVNNTEKLELDFIEVSSIEISTESTSNLAFRLLSW